VKGFCIALQFLTRIPLPQCGDYDPHNISRSVLFYPLIGLLIGLLLGVLALLLVDAPHLVAAALLLSAWVALTGALHLDGLADCTDAWIGGWGNKSRSLSIMKDPTSGPMAICALVLTLLLKWSALTAILDKQLLGQIVLIPTLGRTAMMGLMLSTPYVSTQGLGEALLRHLPIGTAWRVVCASTLLIAWGIGSPPVIASLIVIVGVRYASMQRLGGVTGDVYGAALELSETAALLVAVI
jgi:adenosylcobinamide-GDP ribazoletransferase